MEEVVSSLPLGGSQAVGVAAEGTGEVHLGRNCLPEMELWLPARSSG